MPKVSAYPISGVRTRTSDLLTNIKIGGGGRMDHVRFARLVYCPLFSSLPIVIFLFLDRMTVKLHFSE